MAGLILMLILVQSEPAGERIHATWFESLAIFSLISALSSDDWSERDEAFYHLQLFGQKAVPFIEAIRDRVDYQTRLKMDYLVAHVPLRQEEVELPAGAVQLGTHITFCKNPLHVVEFEAFRMDRYEVTNFMYFVFVRSTGHPAPYGWNASKYPVGGENLPVTGVSFKDALAYARWAGKRLPTTEAWEYAARGHDGKLLPWGDEPVKGAANIDNMRTF
ncbi:MAG: formylglycine-generating enzyme family protein, partial [Planctomycetota bacterium]